MVNFGRTQRDFIRKQVREMMKLPQIGRVVKVYEHDVTGDNSNFEVDVQLPNEDIHHRRIPYEALHSETIVVPKVGDNVLVEFRHGQNNPPIAYGNVFTNVDRAPLGKAGMWKNQFPSDSSPAGDGDIHLTGYTSYDGDPASTEKSSLTPEETWLQIAKHPDNASTTINSGMKIEMYDSPLNNESHVTIELNKEGGADSPATWGLKFDLSDGTFKVLDSNGYGIVSDGDGNFTWHHETVDFSEGTTTSL